LWVLKTTGDGLSPLLLKPVLWQKMFWGKGVINSIYANPVGAAKAVFGWRTTCRDEKRTLVIPVCR
jgi:hypothetical protein